MPPATVQWLDRALVGGRIDHGDALVRGDLRDWPFHHNEGCFEARAEVSDLTFRYAPDWPEVTGVHAVASFIDSGMLVQADGGSSLGVKADKAVESAYYGALEEPMVRQSAALVTVTAAMGRHFASKYPGLSTPLLELPIVDDEPLHRPLVRRPGGRLKVVYAGGLQVWQNVARFIRELPSSISSSCTIA